MKNVVKILLVVLSFNLYAQATKKTKDHKNFGSCDTNFISGNFLGEVYAQAKNTQVENDMLLVPIRCAVYECEPLSQKYAKLEFKVIKLEDKKNLLFTDIYCLENQIIAYSKVLFEFTNKKILTDGKELLYAFQDKYTLGRSVGLTQVSGLQFEFFDVGFFEDKNLHVVQVSSTQAGNTDRKVLAFFVKPSFYNLLKEDLDALREKKLFGQKKPEEEKQNKPKKAKSLID